MLPAVIVIAFFFYALSVMLHYSVLPNAGAGMVGDTLTLDSKSGFAGEKVPRSEVEELVLEEVPDVEFTDIGGLAAGAIIDVMRLPRGQEPIPRGLRSSSPSMLLSMMPLSGSS